MKKQIALFLITVLIIASLTACGSAKKTSSDSSDSEIPSSTESTDGTPDNSLVSESGTDASGEQSSESVGSSASAASKGSSAVSQSAQSKSNDNSGSKTANSTAGKTPAQQTQTPQTPATVVSIDYVKTEYLNGCPTVNGTPVLAYIYGEGKNLEIGDKIYYRIKMSDGSVCQKKIKFDSPFGFDCSQNGNDICLVTNGKDLRGNVFLVIDGIEKRISCDCIPTTGNFTLDVSASEILIRDYLNKIGWKLEHTWGGVEFEINDFGTTDYLERVFNKINQMNNKGYKYYVFCHDESGIAFTVK